MRFLFRITSPYYNYHRTMIVYNVCVASKGKIHIENSYSVVFSAMPLTLGSNPRLYSRYQKRCFYVLEWIIIETRLITHPGPTLVYSLNCNATVEIFIVIM